MGNISQGMIRTHHCGELRKDHVGQNVVLCGWVNKYRNLGGLHFIDIRDKFGLTQLSFEEYLSDIGEEKDLKNASLESIIYAEGIVRPRPDDARNKNMLTGDIEIKVTSFKVLSIADKDNIPFLPFGAIDATEDLKLKFRYLDLRTNKLQNMLSLRSDTTFKTRKILIDEGFVEVETPILYKSTPEGARDYIVPSRIHPRAVYALPQSPQTLKQLLMIGGTDRYFQICRCFRDEDLRADRQPEFTQIDLEVSFATADYIKNLVEKMVKGLFDMPDDFVLPAMEHKTAMKYYGTDKPDLRFDLKHIILTDLFVDSSFSTFRDIVKEKGLIKSIFVPADLGAFSRKQIDSMAQIVKPYGGKGVAWFKLKDGTASGGISKFISQEIIGELVKHYNKGKDGTCFFIADKDHDVTHASSDALRRFLGKELKLIKEGYHFVWIYDWPLLERDKDTGKFVAVHHPFTMPKEEYIDDFFSGDPEKILGCVADAFDLVCNGSEIGGGSIRIHRQDIQQEMFKILGLGPEDIKKQFGFFVEALQFGTPPHGGLAFGFDRIMMLLLGTENIKDVIAFPKTTSATDLMAGSPSSPSLEQISELHFSWRNKS